jgi:HK97 family phage portal protein
MGWNNFQNKSLSDNLSTKGVGPGAPIAHNPGYAGKSYSDSWDIERVYKEGMQKVTWVARCIDAIAGNQARLPIVLRKDNSPDGEILSGSKAKNSEILKLLNTKSNIGENSFIFRYRLSSQLLMSTRGVFIEKIYGRDGGIIGLNLLPPQSTAPIPDPRNFVAGYEVRMPNGSIINMKAKDVVWIRKPHPLDPYLSMTPLEAAGIAVEIENLAKVYNRNYLLNDGRPGGLLVLRGEIDDDDKEELKSRFRGNIARAGATTVISSDDGADFVDTSASPRDAAYIQMRQITKEEILASFGVPESVIGNAAGRTFSNAGEEIRVFWNETMLPHLEPIARALDELDENHYVDFNTSQVPVLILYEQERQRYLKEELGQGLISTNEYRTGTGRKEVESDLADSLLMNPNLTPIANTKKKMEEPPQAGVMGGAPGAPGMPPGAPGMPPGAPGAEGMPPDPTTMEGAMALAQQGEQMAQGAGMEPAGPPEQAAMPTAPGQASANYSAISTKSDQEWNSKVDTTFNRWTEILDRSLERIFERQQRVVLEKASGVKSRKQLLSGSLDTESIFSADVWAKQMDEDIRPVLNAIIEDSQSTFAEKSLIKNPLKKEDIIAHVNSQMARIKSINEETAQELNSAIFATLGVAGEEDKATVLRKSIVTTFTNLLAKKKSQIAEDEARRAWSIGSSI